MLLERIKFVLLAVCGVLVLSANACDDSQQNNDDADTETDESFLDESDTANTPDETDSATAPEQTETTTEPVDTESATAQEDTEPVTDQGDSESATASENTDTATAPENTDTATAPENTDTATAPENTDTTTAPENTDTATAPENTDTATAPENTDTATAPNGTDTATAPKDTDSATAPEDTDSATAPNDTETATDTGDTHMDTEEVDSDPQMIALDCENDGLCEMSVPAVTGYGIVAIDGCDIDDIWAVGDEGLILHYDGTVWEKHVSPTNAALWRISCANANNAWALGEGGRILHFDGDSWQLQSSPTTETLQGIWAGEEAVYIIGEEGNLFHLVDGEIVAMTLPELPGVNENEEPPERLYGPWGSGDDNVWIGAFNYFLHISNGELEWIPLPYESNTITSIAGISGSHLWTTMLPDADESGPYAAEFSDGELVSLYFQPYVEGMSDFAGIRSVAPSDENLVYGIGHGMFDDSVSELHRYDGESWSYLGVLENNGAIWAAPTGDLFIAGSEKIHQFF